jgi:hypothetical protein
MAGPSLAGLTTGMVAGAAASASTASPALAADVPSQQSTSAAAMTSRKVSAQLADDWFAALARGPVDADESAVLGSIAEPSLGQTPTAQANEAESARIDLERLLWEIADSSWIDGEGQGPF